MKKLLFFAKSAFREALTIIIVLSAFVGIIAIIDLSAIISSVCSRVLIVVAIFIASYIFALIKAVLTRKADYTIGDGRQEITIKFGNIFETAEGSTIVIPVNEYFDTIVDGEIIAPDSLHGQFVKEVFGGDTHTLDDAITNDLKKQGLYPARNNRREKGKLEKYPIGTIAHIEKNGRAYFLLALTRFSEQNVVIASTLDEYNIALSSLLEHINTSSRGVLVSLPVLGSGRTRLGKDKKTILGHILSTIRMSNTPIPVKLQIVLDKSDWGRISLHDYK